MMAVSAFPCVSTDVAAIGDAEARGHVPGIATPWSLSYGRAPVLMAKIQGVLLPDTPAADSGDGPVRQSLRVARRPFPVPEHSATGHDHRHCVDGALGHAEQVCAARGIRPHTSPPGAQTSVDRASAARRLCQFLVCDVRETVVERNDEWISAAIRDNARKHGSVVTRPTIGIRGRCPDCQESRL